MVVRMLCAALALGIAIAALGTVQPSSRPVTRPLLSGYDPSMLPALEAAGARHSVDGRPGDALRILRDTGGGRVFRLRLFVSPTTEFNRSWGAVQDLPSMLALAKRVKAVGGELLLDLHYSDTWADPAHQTKPAAWKDLPPDALQARVHDYTAEVLRAFDAVGAKPEYVQVGNEIGAGMLWPDGKLVWKGTEAEQSAAWDRLAGLVNAGLRAVREASTPDRPIRTVVHTHGGGTKETPVYFFKHLLPRCPDIDVLAVSFYPSYGDRFDRLRANLTVLIDAHDKPVWVVETSYPHKPLNDPKHADAMTYPTTPAGQVEFVRDLNALLRGLPNDKGMGLIWWYPEAVKAGDLHIYREGAEAVFDDAGVLLPAAREVAGG